jgi:hypothetical protein
MYERRTMSMSPEERSLRARMAAHNRWAKEENRPAATQPARDAYLQKFLDEVDPDGELPEAERRKRADNARAAHLARMRYEGLKKRRGKKKRPKPGGGEVEIVWRSDQPTAASSPARTNGTGPEDSP